MLSSSVVLRTPNICKQSNSKQ